MTRGRIAAILACGLLIGCGAGGDDDDDIVYPDAGTLYCDMQVSVSPALPQAPATLVATGSIVKVGLSGIESYDWSVDFGGAPVETTDRDPDGREVEFSAPEPGPYRITLGGDVDGEPCTAYTTTVNVTDPNANLETFRLALVPRPDHPAPPQLQMVTISGGADFDVGARSLDSGLLVSGTLLAPGGAAVDGYLRAVATSDPALAIPREAFAAGDGSYQLRLLSGPYDVLIVPGDATIEPARLSGVQATSLTGSLMLPAGDEIAGTVVRADDSPVAGARIALTIDGVPSTIGVTDAAGAFTLRAHPGGATAVAVEVDDGSLPRLELPASAGLVAASGTPLAIRYAAATGARGESFTLVASDGSTPVPGATATFFARAIAAAGTVTPEGGAALDASGTRFVRVTADGAGATGSIALPPAVYDVVVAPPAGSAAADRAHIVTVDLTAGSPAPAALALAAPATVRASVIGATEGTPVTAVPRGMLARASAPTVTAEVTALGDFELALIGGGEYDVTVHAPSNRVRAPLQLDVTAPAPGATLDVGPITLPDAIAITGTVESVDIAGGVSGVTVVLLCGECTGDAAAVPIALTVSGAAGAFTLLVPDPGAAE